MKASPPADANGHIVVLSTTDWQPLVLWRPCARTPPGLDLLHTPISALEGQAINADEMPWRHLIYPSEARFCCPACRRLLMMHVINYDMPGTGADKPKYD